MLGDLRARISTANVASLQHVACCHNASFDFLYSNPMLHTNTGEFQTKVYFNWRPWSNYIEAQIEGKDSPKKKAEVT